jgi:hypothetical protein
VRDPIVEARPGLTLQTGQCVKQLNSGTFTRGLAKEYAIYSAKETITRMRRGVNYNWGGPVIAKDRPDFALLGELKAGRAFSPLSLAIDSMTFGGEIAFDYRDQARQHREVRAHHSVR